jgi:hypothetical protein
VAQRRIGDGGGGRRCKKEGGFSCKMGWMVRTPYCSYYYQLVHAICSCPLSFRKIER